MGVWSLSVKDLLLLLLSTCSKKQWRTRCNNIQSSPKDLNLLFLILRLKKLLLRYCKHYLSYWDDLVVFDHWKIYALRLFLLHSRNWILNFNETCCEMYKFQINSDFPSLDFIKDVFEWYKVYEIERCYNGLSNWKHFEIKIKKELKLQSVWPRLF